MKGFELEQIRDLIYKQTGMRFLSQKDYFIKSKIEQRISELSGVEYMEYVQSLLKISDKKELQEFIIPLVNSYFETHPDYFKSINILNKKNISLLYKPYVIHLQQISQMIQSLDSSSCYSGISGKKPFHWKDPIRVLKRKMKRIYNVYDTDYITKE